MSIAHAIMFTYWLLDETDCPVSLQARRSLSCTNQIYLLNKCIRTAQQYVPRAQSKKNFMENIKMFK